MIERKLVGLLFVIAIGLWLYGSPWFWLPLGLGILLGIIFYRMENKTCDYRVKDDDGHYVVINAKLDAEE